MDKESLKLEVHLKVPLDKIDELDKKIRQACEECGAEISRPSSEIYLAYLLPE